MKAKTNYTHDQTAEIIKLYEAGVTVADIAVAMSRTERSIVAKLTHEGVYRPSPGKPRRTKKSEIIEKIEKIFGLEAGVLESMDKMTHEALSLTLSCIERAVKPQMDVQPEPVLIRQK